MFEIIKSPLIHITKIDFNEPLLMGRKAGSVQRTVARSGQKLYQLKSLNVCHKDINRNLRFSIFQSNVGTTTQITTR
jgi:hypothetical protein